MKKIILETRLQLFVKVSLYMAANLLMNNDYIILCLPTANEKLPVRSPTSGDVDNERTHYTYVKLLKTINLVQMRKVRDTVYIKILLC